MWSRAKRTWLAAEAGISKSTLSRIESGKKTLDVRVFNRLARAIGEHPSAFFGDADAPFLTGDLEIIDQAIVRLYEKRILPAPVPAAPNAQLLTSNVTRRRAITVPVDKTRVVKRHRAAATPDRETFHNGDHVPGEARLQSGINAGITHRDILFVRPEADPRAASFNSVGRIHVMGCRRPVPPQFRPPNQSRSRTNCRESRQPSASPLS